MKASIFFKAFVRRHLVKLLYKLYSKPEGRKLLFDSIPYIDEFSTQISNDLTSNYLNPYQKYGNTNSRVDVTNHPNVIFVTGRFRSGSTLLWNIFRDIPDTTSYYEPFNERQWFNQKVRGTNVDSTHLGVNDYWSEYDGLDSLARFFKEDWVNHQLYMGANSWDPNMLRYIDELIRSGNDRVVLQFNRIDFRLGWIRQHYPKAKIVHIFRNPREQWLSCIKSSDKCDPHSNIESLGNRDFFSLRRWGRDLRYIYPFLDENRLGHLYELFYYLWKLSYNHGLKYSDYSLAIEDISENPANMLQDLFSVVDIYPDNLDKIQSKIKMTTSQKWRGYADDNWFSTLEINCEKNLTNFYHSNPLNNNDERIE